MELPDRVAAVSNHPPSRLPDAIAMPEASDQAQAFPSAAWRETQLGDFAVWQSPPLASIPGLAHAFTAANLNLSTRGGPQASQAGNVRRALSAALRLDPEKLTLGRQVHGIRVASVDGARRGHRWPRVLAETDGLVTTARQVPLLALSADCPLIVAVDASAGALGLAHSGWRGTVAGIPSRLVESLVQSCGAAPDHVIAVITPCAGGDAYEIQDDVRTQVEQTFGDAEPFLHRHDGRIYLDLPRLIAAQLTAAGLAPGRIHVPEQCTIRDRRFHSYRRNGPRTGHAGLIAGWR